VRDVESADNALPHEVLYVFCRDGGKGFSLDPFGEVVDSHQQELGLPFPRGEGADDVHSPNGERPWGDDAVQFFRPGMVEGTKLLALGAFLHVFGTVALYGRPVVADPENLGDHRPRPRVVPIDPLMDLGQNVFGPCVGDTF